MGDEEFSAFFTRHYGAVLGYGLRRVDPDTARDVAAETFLVAWRRLTRPPEDPRAWLLAVARRVLANELRRRARAERLDDRIMRAAAVGGTAAVQPDHADAVAAGDRIAVAMDRLSDRDQEVLRLIAWEGLDQAGAAAVLGCSLTAAKVRLHRARRRLHALLSDGDGPRRPSTATATSATSAAVAATAGVHTAPEDLR